MDSDKPAGVRRDEQGPVNITLWVSGDDDTCRQIMTHTRSNDLPCLPGGSSGQTISGAAVEGSNGDGDDAATEMKMGKNEKKRKRAVRATLYTTHHDGMLYDIPIHSPLGEAYRKLVNREEKREFMIQNGWVRPYKNHRGYDAAPSPKGKGELDRREDGSLIEEVT